MKRVGKEGIASEYLPWIMISVAILVIILLSIFLFKEEGLSLLDRIKGLFRG